MTLRNNLLKTALWLLAISAGAAAPSMTSAVESAPAPAPAAAYTGYFDEVNCNTVSGWVWDQSSPATRLDVTVFNAATGAPVASGRADQYRDDLRAAGFGDGFYGFSIATPASIKDGRTYSLSVRVTDAGFTLGNSPKSFTAPPGGCATQTGPLRMTVMARTDASKHHNFRVQAAGFSVSQLPDRYNVYGTVAYDLWKWNADNTLFESLFSTGYPFAGAGREDCSHATDPRLWHPRCSADSIGLLWKRINCPPTPGVACEDNDRWNASPGRYNVTTFASPSLWPNPNAADFGTPGYANIIDAGKVNSVGINPAGAGCQQFADTTWADDTTPAGATRAGDNETWKWVYASPSPTPYFPSDRTDIVYPNPSPASPSFPRPPFPSWLSHQSDNVAGMHQHYFAGAAAAGRLKVEDGDKLFAYVYLHPTNRPTEIMLQWHVAGSAPGDWTRAYWGAHRLPWPGAPAGSIPTETGWHRLEVDAAQLGLAGKTLDGMAFSLYNGMVTWDRAGKSRPVASHCPPRTGRAPEESFHAYNPDDFATGVANSKAVQVKYGTGESRWFMAFNKRIAYVSNSYRTSQGFYNHSRNGGSAHDNWQLMWATSADGVNWAVHSKMLLRSASEAESNGHGVLVTDMFVDDGYFYVLFQDLTRPHLYLARAPVNPTYSATGQGYIQNTTQGWRIASAPLQANGEYTWQPFALGSQLDLERLGAYPVMPSRSWPQGGFVKQGTIGRVFSTTAAGSSLYLGVTYDVGAVQLWKANSLSRPFEYQSDVVFEDSAYMPGYFGWEFGFTHHPDNTAATPRILSGGFDFWVTEDLKRLSPTGANVEQAKDGLVTLSRFTARVTGF